MSEGEEALAFQLRAAKIPFEREVRVVHDRRFRFDFAICGPELGLDLAVEVEGGSFTGGHKRGKDYESDCEKNNLAILSGWRVLRFTPGMVEDGRALEVIEKAVKAFI